MLILEYLNWEILVLIAGTFNNNGMLAAMVIICTIGGSLITIPYGMSISAVAMVGNALGANRPNEAKANAKLIMMASVLVSVSVTLCLVVFKETIIMIYDDETEVLEFTYPAFITFCAVFNFDWQQNCMCGLIKAVNQQGNASIASFTTMVLISIPLGTTLGVTYGWGLSGLWIGYGT